MDETSQRWARGRRHGPTWHVYVPDSIRVTREMTWSWGALCGERFEGFPDSYTTAPDVRCEGCVRAVPST